MGWQELVERKKEPRHAGQNCGHKKERRPAVQPLSREQPGQHHKPRQNPDQAQNHVYERECRHAQNHDNPPQLEGRWHDPASEKILLAAFTSNLWARQSSSDWHSLFLAFYPYSLSLTRLIF